MRGWVDEWIDGWTCRCVKGWVDKWVDGWVDMQMARCMGIGEWWISFLLFYVGT